MHIDGPVARADAVKPALRLDIAVTSRPVLCSPAN